MVHLASHVGECIHFIRTRLIRQISFQTTIIGGQQQYDVFFFFSN